MSTIHSIVPRKMMSPFSVVESKKESKGDLKKSVRKRKQSKTQGKTQGKTKQCIIGVAFVLFLMILRIAVPLIREPKPPAPDVVASYNGKNITIDDLKAFLLL